MMSLLVKHILLFIDFLYYSSGSIDEESSQCYELQSIWILFMNFLFLYYFFVPHGYEIFLQRSSYKGFLTGVVFWLAVTLVLRKKHSMQGVRAM